MVEDTLAGLGAPRSHFQHWALTPIPLLSRASPQRGGEATHIFPTHSVSCPVCPWPNPLPTHLFHPWSASQPQVHVLYFLIWYYGHSPEVCWTHNTTTWWVANSSQGPVACISAPQWWHVGSLKLTVVGVFTLWKLANCCKEGSFLPEGIC